MTVVVPSPTRPKVVDLMGVPLDAFTPDSLVEYVITCSRSGRGGLVVTPNLDGLRRITHDSELRKQVLGAEVRVADGMPLIWASRVQGTPLPARVAGSDLIFALSKAAAAAGRSIFLVGGNPGAAEGAASFLSESYSRLDILGTHCPPFGFRDDPFALAELKQAVISTQPDIVYIGLPFSAAVKLASDLLPDLPSTWFLGLGISFSFVTGEVHRAPLWMQRMGLEWLHRLIQEPRRLIKRYLLEGLPFLAHLFGHALASRLSSTRAREFPPVDEPTRTERRRLA